MPAGLLMSPNHFPLSLHKHARVASQTGEFLHRFNSIDILKLTACQGPERERLNTQDEKKQEVFETCQKVNKWADVCIPRVDYTLPVE